VLVTRGGRGMALFVPGARTVHIPIVGSDEIADVTGAGDTVMATLSLALAAGATFEAAAHLANHAGGVVVMKRGTATVNADELRASINGTGRLKAAPTTPYVGAAFRRPGAPTPDVGAAFRRPGAPTPDVGAAFRRPSSRRRRG
jgi:hypothetical protein